MISRTATEHMLHITEAQLYGAYGEDPYRSLQEVETAEH